MTWVWVTTENSSRIRNEMNTSSQTLSNLGTFSERIPIDPDVLFKYSLDAVDEEILRYLLKFNGIKPSEVSKAIGHPHALVRRRMKKPSLRNALKDLQLPLAGLLEDCARQAARRMRQLVNDPDKKIATANIRIALGPYTNSATLNVNVKPVTRFSTTVQADGTLLQQILEEERRAVVKELTAEQVIEAVTGVHSEDQ